MTAVKTSRTLGFCVAFAAVASAWAGNLLPSEPGVKGQPALHLVDDDHGSNNSNVAYWVSREDVFALRGKVIHLQGQVQQVRTSTARGIGFTLWARRAYGRKGPQVRIGTGTIGPTPWMDLRLSLRLPEDADGLTVAFDCANGWGQTGEAWFRDVILTADAAELPRPKGLPPSAFVEHEFTELVPTNDTPAMAAHRASYRDQPPTKSDSFVRPEIRNGTWYLNGKPVFFTGPWILNRIDRGNPLNITNVCYTDSGSPEAFAYAGFDSAQISAAPNRYGALLRGLEIDVGRKPWEPDFAAQEADFAKYCADFQAKPLVLDFAFGFNPALPKAIQRRADQKKMGQVWHEFFPLCPECPEGRRYYRDYFLGGTRAALRHGLNVYMYELFNESAYACGCKYNLREFARRMKSKYGKIAEANAVWGTAFLSFWDVAIQTEPEQYDGLRYDWYDFLSDRYVEILKDGMAAIRSVDQRGGIFFTEQAAGTPPVHRGEDVIKLSDTLDALAIEGGWRYGGGRDYEAKGGTDAVVAQDTTKHFYNCDWYAAAARGRVPVVNDEHYCGRFEDGKRVPSKREDYITSLWLELMHGVSATYFYSWDKRSWDYRNLEGARRNVEEPSYKSYSFLNPFNCPPENLDAPKRFKAELAPYAEKVLPFPRVKPATVAVFYSRTREIHRDAFPPFDPTQPKWRAGHRTKTAAWYLSILHAFYPVKVVFARDLATLGPEVKVVVVPEAEAEKVSVVSDLKSFVDRGGKVIAAASAFAYDEYMKETTAAKGAFVRVDSIETMLSELGRLDVPRYADWKATDGKGALAGGDVQICDRGDFKLVCLVAMKERAVRTGLLSLTNLSGEGPWKVTNGVTGEHLGDWTRTTLAKGVPVVLPPQERLILVIEKTAAKSSWWRRVVGCTDK